MSVPRHQTKPAASSAGFFSAAGSESREEAFQSGATLVDTAVSAASNGRASAQARCGSLTTANQNDYNVPLEIGETMNKTELIDHIAQQADISKAAAGRALEAVIDGVRATLEKGDSVTLVGFGTFAVGERVARTGRDPRTGAAITIEAAKIPKFRAGKALKDALN
ncbi:HU family DNA-binding protein [Caballeronia sp. GAFFF1]|uniref:HU family DNA-binding protein n=1 Tax=Caballeronia sp. GAFFF1 TaxID=2921779 RepID=UPI00253FCADF|nr:HU family DNA-binding protein [Caballeronia sp. GAFFF1]